jgi:hypothetical protein
VADNRAFAANCCTGTKAAAVVLATLAASSWVLAASLMTQRTPPPPSPSLLLQARNFEFKTYDMTVQARCLSTSASQYQLKAIATEGNSHRRQ